jgi:hypothetical protein
MRKWNLAKRIWMTKGISIGITALSAMTRAASVWLARTAGARSAANHFPKRIVKP